MFREKFNQFWRFGFFGCFRSAPFSYIILIQLMKNKYNLSNSSVTDFQTHKRQNHFEYFNNLQQKLLSESDKLTNLMTMKSSFSTASKALNSLLNRPKKGDHIFQPQKSQEQLQRAQNQHSKYRFSYIPHKNSHSQNNSKSIFLRNIYPKKQQKEMKITQTSDQIHDLPEEQSYYMESMTPSKSEKMFFSIPQYLKKTSSTASSAIIMDKIDKINKKSLKTVEKSKKILKNWHKKLSIKDFLILKYIQEGQYGTVYLAKHKITNLVCAIKKIPKKTFEQDAKFMDQLIRQIKIQSFLDHPNIVQLFGFFSDIDFIYLILEPCCSGNIYTQLRKTNPLPEDKVKEVIKQVCYALEYMHDNDIIHRDIKPQNILLHENIVKVCDFGWSIHSPLLRGTRCGTPLYSSPEVVQNKYYDNKIDVWNIGIMTYELFFSRVPFEIRSFEDLIKVVDEDIYFPKGVTLSEKAKDFILKCLQKNPKQRLTMERLIDHKFIQQ